MSQRKARGPSAPHFGHGSDEASDAKLHVLSGTLVEIRSQLIGKLEETGAEVIRKRVGRLEIAVVLPGQADGVTNEEGWGLLAHSYPGKSKGYA